MENPIVCMTAPDWCTGWGASSGGCYCRTEEEEEVEEEDCSDREVPDRVTEGPSAKTAVSDPGSTCARGHDDCA